MKVLESTKGLLKNVNTSDFSDMHRTVNKKAQCAPLEASMLSRHNK